MIGAVFGLSSNRTNKIALEEEKTLSIWPLTFFSQHQHNMNRPFAMIAAANRLKICCAILVAHTAAPFRFLQLSLSPSLTHSLSITLYQSLSLALHRSRPLSPFLARYDKIEYSQILIDKWAAQCWRASISKSVAPKALRQKSKSRRRAYESVYYYKSHSSTALRYTHTHAHAHGHANHHRRKHSRAKISAATITG